MRPLWTAAMLMTAAATALRAQESLLPSTNVGAAPVFSFWHFQTPIAQSVGLITDVQQFAVPLRASAKLGDSWLVDVSGAASRSSLRIGSPDSSRTVSLTGLSDVRLRLTGPLAGDALGLTVGVNVPTGTTGLNGDQTAVLQAIAAPALGMPASALGLGPGATVGLVSARDAGDWALAMGAAMEKRTEYTPVEFALNGSSASTKITPGAAVHLTAGADGAVGQDRLGIVVLGDFYATDHVAIGSGGAPSTSSYKLGPQVGIATRLDIAALGWRSAEASFSARYRATFADATGTAVSGSDGTYIEGSWSGVKGDATGAGWIVGIDGRYHSGLKFTDALVGAAVSAGGLTFGAELPLEATVLRIAVRGQYGQFDTGTTRSTGYGASLIFALGAGR
jgi:hypothetical protein